MGEKIMKIINYNPAGSPFGDLLVSLGRKGCDELLWLIEARDSCFSATPALDTEELHACIADDLTMLEILGIDVCVAFPISNPWCRSARFAVVPKNFFDNVRRFIDEAVMD